MKKIITSLCVSVVLGALSTAASAAFPDKTVKFIVPYAPGGAADSGARLIAARLQVKWGQPVVIENRPGATGAIGTEQAAKAPADGYTLLMHSQTILSTELMRPAVKYRTLRDFMPVTTLFVTPSVLMASTTAPDGDLKTVLDAGRKNPDLLNYGSHGEGTITNYLGERLKKNGKVQMVHVPYNSDNAILTDVLGGHLKTGFVTGLSAKKGVATGRARMLAVVSPKRSPLLPDVPTFAELGYDGFDRQSWSKVFAPTGTPKIVVEQIARDITEVVRSPEMKDQFAEMGLVAAGGNPDETQRELQGDYAYWLHLIKEFGTLTK